MIDGRAGTDPTPPDDHEDFLALQRYGLESLPARKRRAVSGSVSQRRGAANEAQCKAFLRSLGFAVYQTGSPGVPKGKRQIRGTMRTPGTPDFLVFAGRLFFFWEAKAGAARLSPEQRAFRALAEEAGQYFGSGDLEALKRYLGDLAVIRYDSQTGFIQKVIGTTTKGRAS